MPLTLRDWFHRDVASGSWSDSTVTPQSIGKDWKTNKNEVITASSVRLSITEQQSGDGVRWGVVFSHQAGAWASPLPSFVVIWQAMPRWYAVRVRGRVACLRDQNEQCEWTA